MNQVESAKDKLALLISSLDAPGPLEGHEKRGFKMFLQSALNDLFEVKAVAE